MLSAIEIAAPVVCVAAFLFSSYRRRVRHRIFQQRLRESNRDFAKGYSDPARFDLASPLVYKSGERTS
jgi:hypothetical protein